MRGLRRIRAPGVMVLLAFVLVVAPLSPGQAYGANAIRVVKYEDVNENGIFDNSDRPVPGWRIQVFQNDALVVEGDTDQSGVAVFTLPAGDYVVKEAMRPTWTNTTPSSYSVRVTDSSEPYLSMYASSYQAEGARTVSIDPYNPPDHANRLNPANALGPFDAVQGQTGVNKKFYSLASETRTNFSFPESFFNLNGIPDIEFAEVTWGSWHAEAAKVYLTDAYVLENGQLVGYDGRDDGIGYYAGVVWNKEAISRVTAARRLEITESYFAGSRDFEHNTFVQSGDFGISRFNLPAEVVCASGVALVDITADVYTEYNPQTYLDALGGNGRLVRATSLSPFAYSELGLSQGNTDGYDLDAIRVRRPGIAFGNRQLTHVSEDLVAQQDAICIPAMVKIHPTLQLAIDKESLFYGDLNPATNASADLTFTVQVKSNLPFRKQVTMTPFNFTPHGVPGDVLQSYNYENGQWVLRSWDASIDGPEPGTGDVIPVEEQSVFITEVNGRTGEVVRPEEQVGASGVYPGDGSAIGDIDNHVFEDQVRWHIGPIKWCDTAGYYVGQLCVTVYQN